MLIKGKLYVLTVDLRNRPCADTALHLNVFQPLIGKGAEIVPQPRYPFSRFRVDLLINWKAAVLSEGQRLQCSVFRVYAEGHFRVIHQVAILLIGMRHGNLVFSDLLDD